MKGNRQCSFTKINSSKKVTIDFSLIEYISEMVSEDENIALSSLVDYDEVRMIVCNINGDSSSGPDSLVDKFYQSSWDMVGFDIVIMVQDFYMVILFPNSLLILIWSSFQINLMYKHSHTWDELAWVILSTRFYSKSFMTL